MKIGKKLFILALSLVSVLSFAFSFGCNIVKPSEPDASASGWEAVELMTDFTVPFHKFE